jgi:integrase
MKPIKKYTLKFLNVGKDKKVALRYFCTCDGIGKTADFSCNIILSREDVVKLNQENLDGLVQKECYKIKQRIINSIDYLSHKNNLNYPTPDELKHFVNVTSEGITLDYCIREYLKTLRNRKDSTKNTYGYALQHFKRYVENNLKGYRLQDLINRNVVNGFGDYYVDYIKNVKEKDCSKISTFNYQNIAFMFLNYVAEILTANRIEEYLKRPEQGAKYNITESDVEQIINYNAKSLPQKEVQAIIKINIGIGLRIGEIMTIHKDNVNIFDNVEVADAVETIKKVCTIRLAGHKKTKERTVVNVDPEAINIIQDHLVNNYNKKFNHYLFHFNNRSTFNQALKKMCEKVFKEETVLVYKNTESINDYQKYFKHQVISSHAFRRFAMQRNTYNFGIEVARTQSGHSDYRTITKHYSNWLNADDLENILLKK